MRVLFIILVVALAAGPAWPLGYEEFFDYPDGSFPPMWVWTGYSTDGDSFQIHDSSFANTGSGETYYFRPSMYEARENLGGMYLFEVKDSNWVFAWRITPYHPSAGRCVWLSHDNRTGSWGYTFAEFSWQNLDAGEFPDGQYMWHNGTALRTLFSPTAGPLVGWNEVWINDIVDGWAHVKVNGEVVFDLTYEFIEEGYQGIGTTGGSVFSPAYDSMIFQWPDAVEQSSWGRIKELFR